MANDDSRDREIAELKARLAALEGVPGPSIPPTTSKPKPKKPGGGMIVLGVIVLILVFAMIVGSHPSSTTTANATSDIAATATPTGGASPATASGPPDPWTYSDTTDAMGRTSHLACTTSTNNVTQGAPYEDVDVRLCLRRKPGSGLNVFVELNGNGQVLCGIESCSIPVRFDSEAITHFPGTGAADNSSNIIFLESETHFAQRLRRSKKVAVELTIYQNGVQGVTFDTRGLKWG